jgi:hypothetical protein
MGMKVQRHQLAALPEACNGFHVGPDIQEEDEQERQRA